MVRDGRWNLRTRGRKVAVQAKGWPWLLGRTFFQAVFLPALRVRVFGAHNVPQVGGAMIVSNHQSYLDPVLLSLALRWPVAYMARRSLFRHPAFALLLRMVNVFPITRGGRDVRALRETVERLRAGERLVVFPEGSRTTDGEIGPLRPGVARLAVRAQVPIVPAVIEGAFQAWPRGRVPWPHSVAVSYGRPVAAAECSRMRRGDLLAYLRAEMLKLQMDLRDRMNRARGDSRRE